MQIQIPEKETVFLYMIFAIICCQFLGFLFKIFYYKTMHNLSYVDQGQWTNGNELNIQIQYLLCNSLKTLDVRIPLICFLPNILRCFLTELKLQLRSNLLRSEREEDAKSKNKIFSFLVFLMSFPIYLVLLMLLIIIFVIFLVSSILLLPIFLLGRLFLCNN